MRSSDGVITSGTAEFKPGRHGGGGVPVGRIKQHITAKRNVDKGAVVAAVQALGFDPPDDNEAGALALLHWALRDGGRR